MIGTGTDRGTDAVSPSLAIGATPGTRYAKAWRIPTPRIGLVTPSTPCSTPSFVSTWSPSFEKSRIALTATACLPLSSTSSATSCVAGSWPKASRGFGVRSVRSSGSCPSRASAEASVPAVGAADGGARGHPRRRPAAAGAGAPVGAHPALSPALLPGLGSHLVSRGARRVCPDTARLLRAHGARTRHPGRPDRHRHGDPTLRQRSPIERPLPYAGARRGLQPASPRAAHLSPRAPTERQRRGTSWPSSVPGSDGCSPAASSSRQTTARPPTRSPRPRPSWPGS